MNGFLLRNRPQLPIIRCNGEAGVWLIKQRIMDHAAEITGATESTWIAFGR